MFILILYRSLYISAGTCTAVHTDYFNTAALMFLLHGKKLWITCPPSHTDKFRELFITHSANESGEEVSTNIPLSRPWTEINNGKFVQTLLEIGASCIILDAGDAIYLPPRYPHFVYNLSFTISFGSGLVLAPFIADVMDFVVQSSEKGETWDSLSDYFNIDFMLGNRQHLAKRGVSDKMIEEIQVKLQEIKNRHVHKSSRKRKLEE